MMPDWKAELAEKANAIANALATNSAAAAGIDQYFVDASAYPPIINGFTVTLPTFQAVFAQGSSPVQVGGISYTVTPNTTSRAWLFPNNTIQIVTDGSIVPGAIPYLFEQSNSGGITGTIESAQVGLLQIPASYLIEGNLYTPIVTAPGGSGSPEIIPSAPGQFVTQLTIEVEVTNQPVDGSCIKTILYYRQVGQPTWLQFATSPPRNAIAGADGQGAQLVGGATSSTGLYVWIYPEAANGTPFEFGLAQESNRGTETAVISLGSITVAQPTIPPTSITGNGSGNFIPDAQFAHVLAGGGEAYLNFVPGTNFYAQAGSPNQPFGLMVWRPGVAANRFFNTQAFMLPAGTYNFSAYLDLINATGVGGLTLQGPLTAEPSPTYPGLGAATVATLNGSPSNAMYASQMLEENITIATAGMYCVQGSNAGLTVGGSPIFMGLPCIVSGSNYLGFIPSTPVQTTGSDAGTTAHLAASVGVQTALGPTGNILPTATATQSKFLNAQGSVVPIGVPSITLTSGTTSGQGSVMISAPASAVYFPSNGGAPTAFYGFGQNVTGLAFGTTYYFSLAYNPNTNSISLQSYGTSPITQAQEALIYADGLVPLVAQAYVATPATAGGTGSSSGGGGGIGGRNID